MGKSQEKRLLAASERFRRDYICYFLGKETFPDGVTHIYASIKPRIPNHKRAKRVWK
jgi:hypothetical protein